MSIGLHWYLPTHGDGRTLTQAGAATLGLYYGGSGGAESEPGVRLPTHRYLTQVALAAEAAGFDAVLTPTGTWCEDAWITTASLIPVTSTLRFIVAFRPGAVHPTLAAQQAAAFSRLSGGRVLVNIVTGGEPFEQRRFGDELSKAERYARTDEFLTVLRGAWSGTPTDFRGAHLWAEGATAPGLAEPPEILFGGSSDPAIEVAARQADVYLTWGEPPAQIAAHLDRVRALADAAGRTVRFGIRLHVVTRADAADAWRAAEALLDGADDALFAGVKDGMSQAEAVGQQRQFALHGGDRSKLEVSPNLWAGVGLLRSGAGTALVGSHEEVADRIAEYHALGIDEFILSGYPHLEEAHAFGEGVRPILRDRGLLRPARPAPVAAP